jgi:hypothetical protein
MTSNPRRSQIIHAKTVIITNATANSSAYETVPPVDSKPVYRKMAIPSIVSRAARSQSLPFGEMAVTV